MGGVLRKCVMSWPIMNGAQSECLDGFWIPTFFLFYSKDAADCAIFHSTSKIASQP